MASLFASSSNIVLSKVEETPASIQRVFYVWAVTSTIQLVPSLFIAGYECYLLWKIYVTVLTDWDAFEGQPQVKENPVEARNGQTLLLLGHSGTMVTNVFLLLFSTPLVLYIGGVYKTESIHDHARWLTRALTFIAGSAIFAIFSTIPMLMILPFASLIAMVTVFAALRILQVAFTLKLLDPTLAISPRAPYEIPILGISFALLLISLFRLGVTPSLFTGSSCECSWDVYPNWVRICLWVGGGVNCVAVVMTATVCVSNFLNNTSFLGAYWYTIIQTLDSLVLLSGVVMTDVMSGRMFNDASQDMKDKDVWWALHEQPLVTLAMVSLSIMLSRTLQFLLWKASSSLENVKSASKSSVKTSKAGAAAV